MTLTTHGVIAAAVTRPLMSLHPALIFVVGIATHYLSDVIPHWDYHLGSFKEDDGRKKKSLEWSEKTAGKDLAKISLDFFLGYAIVFLAVRPDSIEKLIWVLVSVIGGMLPDLLQGINLSLKKQPLRPLQWFHDFCHTKIRLGPYPLVGIPFQLAIFAVFLWMLF